MRARARARVRVRVAHLCDAHARHAAVLGEQLLELLLRVRVRVGVRVRTAPRAPARWQPRA